MNDNHLSNTTRRGWRILRAAGIALLLLGGLLLDLQFRGLVWQFAWSQTGEESVLGQLRGLIELPGNLMRVQPRTDPYAPIQHSEVSPFSVNTFFEQETEVPKMHEQFRMIRAAGFTWIRQEFPWEEIEVDGRGQFTDSRLDYDGDGSPDTINAWTKFDRIVDLADEYGIQMIVRLSNPPAWTRSDPDAGTLAPPDDYQDFVNYAVAVAERYQGRIRYFQVWNEPNIFPEWGNDFADPAAYTEMLCRTHDALKAVDPNIVVISAAIAPTISLDGFFGYQDVVYLERMYEAGAGACFDVLAAQGYGLFSGPTDHRMRTTTTNYARHVFYRDIMVAHGDAHKSIWLSEVGWNPVLDAFRPREEIADYDRYGTVTNAQAARYLPIAYQRALEEWPWVGNISTWFFTRPTIEDSDHSSYYFRLVEADYSREHPTFTPLPVYNSIQDYITATSAAPRLYRGTHQAESWEVVVPAAARLTNAEGAQFAQAVQSDGLAFSAQGTALRLRVRTDTEIRIFRQGTFALDPIPASDGWQYVTIYESFLPQDNPFVLEADAPFLLDSITVVDHTARNVALLLLLGGGYVLLLVGVIWRALRERRRTG